MGRFSWRTSTWGDEITLEYGKGLRGYARANRGRIIVSLLMIMRAWYVAGRPEGSEILGSFEPWAKTIGGALLHAGVKGFTVGTPCERFVPDDDAAKWESLLRLWLEHFGREPVKAAEVARELLSSERMELPDRLADALEAGKEPSRALGKALSKVERRRFAADGLRVERVSRDGNATLWRVLIEGETE